MIWQLKRTFFLCTCRDRTVRSKHFNLITGMCRRPRLAILKHTCVLAAVMSPRCFRHCSPSHNDIVRGSTAAMPKATLATKPRYPIEVAFEPLSHCHLRRHVRVGRKTHGIRGKLISFGASSKSTSERANATASSATHTRTQCIPAHIPTYNNSPKFCVADAAADKQGLRQGQGMTRDLSGFPSTLSCVLVALESHAACMGEIFLARWVG